jgi:hypothetical protein
MTALGPGEIQARRRPLVVLALALLRLLCGFCLASPLAALVSASGVGLQARGDRTLFEGGGYLLLEVARLQGPSLLSTSRGLLPLFLLGLTITVAGNAVLLYALNVRESLTSLAWVTTALRRLPAFLVVAVGTALAQGALFIVGIVLAGGVPDALASPVRVTALQGAVWLFTLALLAAMGGFADVTKAALVRNDAKLSQALAHAAVCVQKRPVATSFGWVPQALTFAAAAGLVAAFVGTVDVSRPGAWRVAFVFTSHQLLVLVSLTLRAAWFAKALRLVATI